MQEASELRNSECTHEEMRPRGIYEWVDFYQKNKPQTNALAAGIMTVLYGGQQLGWGIFNNHLKAQPWAGGYEDEGTVFWAITAWFIAAIVGFIASSFVVNKFSKMSIYVFTSILAGASATMFIVRPENIYFIVPARVIAGFSYGVVYPTVLMHASEVAIAKLRGMIVSSVHFCFIVGVFTTSSSLLPVYQSRNYEVDPTRTIGINGLICIVTGLLIAIFFNRESPVFLIRKYREQEALKIMVRLRSESHETVEIRNDFNEFKMMVMEDAGSNLNIFDRKNRWPLSVVMMLKIIFVASFNMPLNTIFLEATEAELYNGNTDPSGMCLSGTRWIVMMFFMFVIDFKRIKFYVFSSGACSLILLLLFYVLRSSGGGFDESTAITVLAFGFQMASGIAIGMVSDIYAVEAFNTRKKPLSIAITSSVEFLLQIFLVATFFYLKVSMMLMVGLAVIIMGAGIFAYILPDTSGMSLRNARNKFSP